MAEEQFELIEETASEELGFWDVKKEQASDVAESLGELLGGDERVGWGVIGTGILIGVGVWIKGRWDKRKQKKRERLYQETLKKQDAMIQDLKHDSAECHARQQHYKEILEAYSAESGGERHD